MQTILKRTLGLAILVSSVLTATSAQEPAPISSNEAATSPWGVDDQIGALNMMAENSVTELFREVNSNKVYDLSVELFVGMPTCCESFGDPSYQIWMTHVPSRQEGELLSHSSEAILMNTHTGTHIDTLSHFGLHGKIWNKTSAHEALGPRGWEKSGAEQLPPIIARGVLLDVAAAKGVSRLSPSYAITAADLKQAISRQGLTVRKGDVVLIRTGQMQDWPNASELKLFEQAGLSLEAAQWLATEKQAIMIGADNLGLEHFPSANPDNFAPVHSYLLAEKGVPIIEALWLEELAADDVDQFVFIATPLKFRGASGSPIRPLALPLAQND